MLCYNKGMSDIDYLNKIAKDNRLAKKPGKMGGKISFDSNIVKFIIGAVVAVIFVVILGSILGKTDYKERDSMDKIFIRETNLAGLIEEYNDRVKSSTLRSMAKSLRSVLVESRAKVGSMLIDEYQAKDPEEPRDAKTLEDETQHYEELMARVNDGWLNGYLDRHYVRELTTEIVLLMSMESDVIERTNKAVVSTYLTESRNNLQTLYAQFDGYENSTN